MRHGIDTGIDYGIPRLPGMVTAYEEKLAAQFSHYREDEWKATHWRQKAREVAFYRLYRLISLHTEEAKAEAEIQHLQNANR